MLRPNGRRLCVDCNQDRVREMSPTGLTRNEERITYGLYKYFRECGLGRGDALEKLAFVLALEPQMFTRMVNVLEGLRE